MMWYTPSYTVGVRDWNGQTRCFFFLGLTVAVGGLYDGHSIQNPRRTQKPIYDPILTHHIRSWLLCFPLLVDASTAVLWILLRRDLSKSPVLVPCVTPHPPRLVREKIGSEVHRRGGVLYGVLYFTGTVVHVLKGLLLLYCCIIDGIPFSG